MTKLEKEKLSRRKAEVAAQKENIISEDLLKSLDDEIRKEKEKLSRRKLKSQPRACILTSYRVMMSKLVQTKNK